MRVLDNYKSENMDLILRRVLISVWFLLFIGNVNAQGGGGVAIGLGLGGDLMVDTAFGELPNPLVTMAAGGGHQSTGTTGSQAAPAGTAQLAGGGFNVQGFSTFGSDINTLFPIDASRIAGIANGQTIYLPGFLGNQLHYGSRVILPAQPASTSPVDSNQQYVLQNEEFTALGNVGHLVRVPVPDAPSSNSAASISITKNASSSETTFSGSVESDGTIAIDPKDIIGVADMNVVGPDGNPQFFSFNPGTGHASEISALQSAMKGTAVDMSGMLPPPYDPLTPLLDPVTSSMIELNTSSSSTSESTSVDVVTIDNSATSSGTSSDQTGTSANVGGSSSMSTLSDAINQNARARTDGSIMSVSNTKPNMFGINEQSLFDTGGLNMQSMFDTGTATGSLNLNQQLLMDKNAHPMLNMGTATSGYNLNEQTMLDTLKQSMFDTGATGSMKLNEQSMLNTGSAPASNSLNEQTMMDTLEQSMFDTGASGIMKSNEQSMLNTGSAPASNSLNEPTMMDTLEQSMFNTGAAGTRMSNGQSMFNTGSATASNNLNEQTMMGTLEQSMFDTGASGSMKLNEQSMLNTGRATASNNFNEQTMMGTLEQSMFDTGASGSMKSNEQSMLNTGSAPASNSLNEPTMMDTLEQSMFNTGAAGTRMSNGQSMFNTGSATASNSLNEQTMMGTLEQSMFDTGASGSMKSNEQSMLNTGSAPASNSLNEQTMMDTLEQSMFNTGAAGTRMSNGQSMFNTGRATASNSLNEHTMMDTLEQSMFDTVATDKMKSNNQSMLTTGSVTGTNNLLEQSLMSTLEQSVFDTGATGSIKLSEPSLLNTKQVSTDNTGSTVDGTHLKGQYVPNTNEHAMFDTRGIISETNMNEQSMLNPNLQSLHNEFGSLSSSEQSLLSRGGSSGQNQHNINDRFMTNNANDAITNKLMIGPNEIPLLNTKSADINLGTGLKDEQSVSKSIVNTEIISGRPDRFSSGKDNLGITDKNQNTLNVNEASMFNSATSNTFNSGQLPMNTGRIGNDFLNANDQSMTNIQMQKAPIITNDQLGNINNELTKHKSGQTNESKMFNVDTTIGVRNGQPQIGRTSIGGMFGIIDSQNGRQNVGLTGSRFSGINTQINTGTNVGSRDTYTNANNVAQSASNTGELSSVGGKVDLINRLSGGPSNLLRTWETKDNSMSFQSLPSIDSVTSSVDSSKTISLQQINNQPGLSGQNVPHVSDLNTEGVYPFEGSFTARDATLTEGSPAIVDMNSVLQGHEPLHLEPSIDIVGEVISGTSTSQTLGNNTGVYAVVKGSNAVADVTVDITKQGAVGGSNSASKILSNTYSPMSENTMNKEAAKVSFISDGESANKFVIDKVNEYVGVDNMRNNGQTHFGGNGIAINLNGNANINRNSASSVTSKISNSTNTLTKGDQSTLNAYKLSLTSLNDHMNGLMVAGNNNNDINTFNTLETSRNVVNNKITTVTDGVDVAMSGFSGAPITNMVGVIPGKSSGGLAVSGFNVPSFQSTSTSTSNEFSSSLTQEFTGSTNDNNTSFPSGSFVIGAGQPNSKIISAGRVEPSSLSSNAGGVALGSNQGSGLASISLPASAFKSNDNMLKQEKRQTNKETQKTVKVDMSNFIPPPFEESTASLTDPQVQTTHRVGSTADLIKNVLNRQNRNNRFSSNTVSNPRSTFESLSDTNVNTHFPSNPDSSRVHRLNNIDSLSGFGQSSFGTSNAHSLTSDGRSNLAIRDAQARNNRFDINSNQNTAFASRPNINMNGMITSHRDASDVGRVRLAGTPLKSRSTSTEQMSSIVKSNEHFGKILESNTSPSIPVVSESSAQTSSNIIEQQYAIPSLVTDRTIFTDMARDANANLSANSVVAALDMHANINQATGSLEAGRSISKPIVGSIFGTGANSSSTLTQKFLERSGITREPAVDFMTSFLHQAKPTRPQSGSEHVQIVPLSNVRHNSGNIITGRQSDAQTVDQFGVADIYTRRQQLNPSQWQQLMSKVSHDQKTGQINNVDYQTQNVIGASETKPLSENINAGTATRLSSSGLSSELAKQRFSENAGLLNTNTRAIPMRQNSIRSSILFEAPGMTGHKSVTIPNYKPRSLKQVLPLNTFKSNSKSSNQIGQQNLQEFVGSQTTAERTSSFANTFRQNQQTGTPGVPLLHQNNRLQANSVPLFHQNNRFQANSVPLLHQNNRLQANSVPLLHQNDRLQANSVPLLHQNNRLQANSVPLLHQNNRLQANSVPFLHQNNRLQANSVPLLHQNNRLQANSVPLKDQVSVNPPREGQLGESGQKIQNEMHTFKLGESILISDGVIPEFTGPNSVHTLPIDAHTLQSMSINGMRLGQPAVMSQRGSLGSVDNTRSASSKLQSEAKTTSPSEVTLQDIQRAASRARIDSNRQTIGTGNRNIGVAVGGLNRNISPAFSQAHQNTGFVDTSGQFLQNQQSLGVANNIGGLTVPQQGLDFTGNKDISISSGNQNIGIAIRGDLDTGLTVTSEVTQNFGSSIGNQQSVNNQHNVLGGQLSTDATGISQKALDTATIMGLNDVLKKQPMEPTLFTSGSRFAVFGRAGDVTGKEVGNGHLAKAIPARRMGVLGPVHDCRYKPDPSSEYYFIYKNGITQHRFRCALGTAFDEMTCECSIRVSDHGDCLEVHMDFNNGFVEDSSLNRLPIGNENVDITNSSSPLAGIALFGGDGKLTIWRYQNYDFRDHVMLKVQFRPGVGGDRYQPLITNCDSSATEPSLGIVYDNMMKEAILMLKTVNDTLKELRFKVNPDEWSDVTFIYDGQEFIGIVNGVRRYVSRENPHLLGLIGGEIKSAPTHGLIEIRDAAIVVGHCPMYGNYRGAMVDIQIYTCIPKDFRLE